jgi:hypothetical protein
MNKSIEEIDNLLKIYNEKIIEYESNINEYYVNFKTTIDLYDKEYMIDINGIEM